MNMLLFTSPNYKRDHKQVYRDWVIRFENFETGEKGIVSSRKLGELIGEDHANRFVGKAYHKGADECELRLRGKFIITFKGK